MAKQVMGVKEFLDGDFLRRSDVVLCSSKKNMFSRLIRYGTRSPFCHAALVFLVRAKDQGFGSTFLIEAGTSGVDLTDFRHYVVDSHYQVGIKRLEQDWFQSRPDGERLQRLVRGRMLDFIKAEYDYITIWRVAKSILRRIVFGVQRFYKKGTTKAFEAGARAPNQFICSGFVQYGFYETVTREAGEDEILQQRVDQVVFYDGQTSEDPINSLLAATPEDLARSTKLKWKWVISRGEVYEVESYEEARDLMMGREV